MGAADRAGAGDGGAHGLEHRLGAGEVGIVAATEHDREFTRAGPADATGHRCVEEGAAGGADPVGELPCGIGNATRHFKQEGARAEAGEDAGLTLEHRLDDRARRQHGDDDVGAFGHRGGGRSRGRVGRFGDACSTHRICIGDREGEARRSEPGSHRLAHGTEADEADCGGGGRHGAVS